MQNYLDGTEAFDRICSCIFSDEISLAMGHLVLMYVPCSGYLHT